ncbi:MAG TPA: LamG-like jellyroll fold domain-containing protein [Verrucomicrobiae bacterium]|nr:LamG-like jellyroll fold domain-containing protein [Verrucomicrobiae bacterium]
MNLSTNPPAGNTKGAYAFVTNNTTLGNLGIVSNFTATIWVKMSSLNTNLSNGGTRLFVLATNGVVDDGVADSIGINIQTGSGPTPNAIAISVGNNHYVTAPIYYNFPTNVWLFLAMTYDSGSGNAEVYYGTEASPAKLFAVKNIGAGTNFNFSGSASLSIGNSINNAHDFPGSIDEFRFYTGAATGDFIENVREQSTPVVISSLTPDGSVLMDGTNTLSFTASSANGINPSNVKVAVNGTDVSSSLSFSGPATAQTVTYANLPVNPPVLTTVNLNGVSVSISVTDNNGITTTNSYVYDAYSPTNFTWEAEDYDYSAGSGNGQPGFYMDNPPLGFTSDNPYYQSFGSPEVDYQDNGAGITNGLSTLNTVNPYRDANIISAPETEYSYGTGINGGNSIGELMRQRVMDALISGALPNGDIDMGYFDGGSGQGLPNWVNYTRTFPKGAWNVYIRSAEGSTSAGSTLASVTGGWGSYPPSLGGSLTTTNLGTFTSGNTGGWQSYAWTPLRDANGNLVRVDLNGTNTFQLTAGTPTSPTLGGGNVNFLMLVPANTNVPVIGSIYPNGTNMFQPANGLTFTASSPVGTTINASSISVQLTYSNLLGQAFTTNFTTANGLVVTGTSANRSVSAPLQTNFYYSATIFVTDANGNSAQAASSFDTLNPVLTWEAEDYNYGNGQFIDNPTTDAYNGLAGASGVDYNFVADSGAAWAYRPQGGGVGDQVASDTPKRLPYIGTGFNDYNVGWFDNGDWLNYTRTFPSGSFNVFVRAANGSSGNLVDTFSQVTSDRTQPNQTLTALGTFTTPPTGSSWQVYTWVPLRDASGNLVKLQFGGVSTFRVSAAASGNFNANFYALFPANTNLPAINNVYPDGSAMFQPTNKFTFNVTSAAGVSQGSVSLVVNGTNVSSGSLTFSGSQNNWNVSFPLSLNTSYTITINVVDSNGNTAATTKSFATFSSNYYTWEAEDFDYDGGKFIDNPQTNAYSGKGAVAEVDTHQVNFAAAAPYLYRTNDDVDLDNANGMSTEINGDQTRAQWNFTNDYTAGYFSANAAGGSWMNYTRHYPAGSYNVYGRLAAGGGATTCLLSKVTSGLGTSNQTVNLLGTFNIPNTAWESYTFVPLVDDSGNPITVTFDGSATTLRLSRPDTDTTTSPDCNANFLMLVPASGAGTVTLTASVSGGNIVISFSTGDNTHSYQVQYKNSLTDASWTPLGSPLVGNNSIQSVSDAIGNGSRFYRVQIQ